MTPKAEARPDNVNSRRADHLNAAEECLGSQLSLQDRLSLGKTKCHTD